MKIVFDLDGVLRDLSGHVAKNNACSYPKKWDEKYNGKDIFECVNENPNLLLSAPPTGYLKIAMKHFDSLEIWTHQLDHWKENTLKWIHRNVGEKTTTYFLEGTVKQERAKSQNLVLIEDSPNFTSYEDILLIDRPYNQEVKGVMRVFGPRHLDNLIELIKLRS